MLVFKLCFVKHLPEQLLYRNGKRFRGGLVFKAHIWLYHFTLGSRVIKKKKKHAPLPAPTLPDYKIHPGDIPGAN